MSAPSASTPASSPAPSPHLHLAVALDGAGRHPAWREPGRWAGLVSEAERGLLDFVTIDPRGRLDAVLVAARVARQTRHIGLVPTVVATHAEPFHVARAIATLDHVSDGRAGLRVQVSARRIEAAQVGRRTFSGLRAVDRDSPGGRVLTAELFDEAAHHVEVVRRTWERAAGDAEVRDVPTGTTATTGTLPAGGPAGGFGGRRRLHHLGLVGRRFGVVDASATPRPPQGQPVVSTSAHGGVAYRLVGRAADIGYVTPRDADHARAAVAEIRTAQAAAGRAGERLHVFGDLVVFLDGDAAAAEDRRVRLEGDAGEAYTGDATVFTGTPGRLADLLLEWRAAGLTGFRLRPGEVTHDLERITRELVPELQRRGAFRRAYEADTLRGRLGLGSPADRRATAGLAGAARR